MQTDGRLRIGWKLAAGAAAGFGTLAGVMLLLSVVFDRLFAAWGVTMDNLAYAPVYAQQIVFWHTDFIYASAYTAGILVCAFLAKRWTKPAANHAAYAGKVLLAGLACGAALTAISLAADSMRLEWPLDEPFLSPALLSGIAVLALGCLFDEILGKRLFFDPVLERFGRPAAYAVVAILSMFANISLLGCLNGVLLSLLGCVIYERGGILASAALQAGWMVWTNLLFAWPDVGSVSLYRMYSVSDAWFTGGGAGAECGLGCTVLWMSMAAVLLRRAVRFKKKERITNGEDSHCNRRSGLPR